MQWLAETDTPGESVRRTLDSYLRTGKSQRQEMLLVNRQIRELCQRPEYREPYGLLVSIPGIGFVSAVTFLVAFGDITRFSNLDKLCHYVGLVPRMHGSGDRLQVGMLVNRGRKELKVMLIEAAWDAIGTETALLAAVDELPT